MEIKATESVASIATAAGAILIFLMNGVFDLWYVVAYIPGAIIGAYIGVKLALRLGDTRLRALVWLSISVISIKTIMEIKTLHYLQQLAALLF